MSTSLEAPDLEQPAVKKEHKLEIQSRNFEFGELHFEAPVMIGSKGQIIFPEDVNVFPGTLTSIDQIQALFNAEILKEGNPPGCKSTYLLSDTNSFRSGRVHLDKNELNDAIDKERLKLKFEGRTIVIDK